MRPSTHFVTLLQLMPTNLGMLNVSAIQSSSGFESAPRLALLTGRQLPVVGPIRGEDQNTGL
jgi:hypothetical protein